MITTFIIALVIFSVIVLVHELGHFITAKSSGVKVEEFGIGFPPRLYGITRGETIYSINWIPFGGFNKVTGEVDPDLPRSLASKNAGIRLLFFSAGSIMNLLLPLVLFSIAFMLPHNELIEPVVVKEIAPGSPAAMTAMEPGDTILSLNDKPVQSISELQRDTNLNLGREVTLLVRHSDATTEEIKVVPRWKPPEGQGAIGVLLDAELALSGRTIVSQSEPIWRALPMSVNASIEAFILYKNGIIGMITGAFPAALTGPVGIVQMMGEVAKVGISPLLEFAALISMVVGLVNLFPLPALDGGRIAFIVLELLRRGKRVSPKIEGLVHSVGFILLLAVMALITYQDIIRIITGDNILP
jgi:regulator of sigma E protease